MPRREGDLLKSPASRENQPKATGTGLAAGLTFETRQKEDVVVIEASGRLALGEPLAALRSSIESHLESGMRNFLLDMGGLTYIDSTGLAALVVYRQTILGRNGQLGLLKLTPRVKERLRMTKLETVFDAYQTEAEALAALRNAPDRDTPPAP